MKKWIFIIVGAVFVFLLVRAFVIIILLLTTPQGETHRQGLIIGHKGDWEAAIEHFDEVIRMKPYHDKAYTTRAFAKLKLGNTEGAIEDSRTAIDKYPFYGESYAVLGLAELQSGQQNNGCKNLQTALDLGYERAKNYINQYCK